MGESLYLHKLRAKVASWIEWAHESTYCRLRQDEQFTIQETLCLGWWHLAEGLHKITTGLSAAAGTDPCSIPSAALDIEVTSVERAKQ